MDWDEPSLDYKPKQSLFIRGVSSQSARLKDYNLIDHPALHLYRSNTILQE